jgi:16S rRNA processing protein RimM
MEKRLVPIGKVVRLHGIKGKVKLHYFSDDLSVFLRYRDVIIEDRAGVPRTYEVLEATPQPPRLILKLKGIEKIEDAEPLVNREVFIEREALPEPEKGEHYWVDLLGMDVESDQGKKLGKLQEIFSTGANDVFVVQGRKGEIFLPATDEVIKRIDHEKGVIEVHWMEGLWEEEDEV